MAIRNMFSQFDEDMNNVITREEFIKVTGLWELCIPVKSSQSDFLALSITVPCSASLHAVCIVCG